MKGLGFRVWGLGLGFGFRVYGVPGLGFRDYGLRFRVEGLGFLI